MKSMFYNLVRIFVSCAFLMMLAVNVVAFEVKIVQPENNATVKGVVSIISEFFRNKSTKNGSYREINQKIESAARQLTPEMVKDGFDDECLKTLSYMESSWRQYKDDGKPYIYNNKNGTYDIGLFQLNNRDSPLGKKLDIEKCKTDIDYNIQMGLEALQRKYQSVKNVMENQPKRRERWERRYDLKGYTVFEVTLKYYNSMRKSWEYLDMYRKEEKQKKWEQEVDVSLLIDGKGIAEGKVKRIEQYKYSWDTGKEEAGKHIIHCDATTQIGGKREKFQDSKNVIVKKKEEEKETGIEKYVFTYDDVTRTFNSFSEPPNIQVQLLKRELIKACKTKVGVAPPIFSQMKDYRTAEQKKNYRPEKFMKATLSLDAISPVPTFFDVNKYGIGTDNTSGYIENVTTYHYIGSITDYKKLWNGLTTNLYVSIGSCPPHTDPPYSYSVRNIKLVIELKEE